MPILSVNSWFGTKSPFFTQTMRHCVPNPGVILIMSLFFTGSIIFLIISAVAFSLGASQAYGRTYYDTPKLSSYATAAATATATDVSVTVRRLDVHKPLYIYYHLEDFHQNSRFYVSSYDRKQLQASDFLAAGYNENCKKEGTAVNQPCGLIYKSLFNDTFVEGTTNTGGANNKQVTFSISGAHTDMQGDGGQSSTTPTTKTIPITMDGIAWKEDYSSNKMYGEAFRKLSNPESVAVWMRTAPFSMFDKLYGYIPEETLNTLVSGNNTRETIYLDSEDGGVNITFKVSNNFPYGKKAIVVQQMTIFGGYYETRNVAILAIVLGCILFACGLAFLILFLERGPRSASYKTVLEQYPIVTNSSILLAELEKTGDEKVRRTIRQVKTEMGLK